MKAAFLTAPRRVEVLDAPAPAHPAPGQVLVRINAVGVCGSDIHYFSAGGIGAQKVEYPWIMGHECAGTILEVGAPHALNATKGGTGPVSIRFGGPLFPQGNLRAPLQPGTRVAIDPLVACGECDQCLAQRRHTCRRQKFLGMPGQLPGALAERMLLPAECCFPIPDSMTTPQAVMVEPLSIGLYAVGVAGLAPPAHARAGISGGETPPLQKGTARVAVLGAGPIGLCVILALGATLDATIYATDLVEERVAAARRAGAGWAGNPIHEDVVSVILRHNATAVGEEPYAPPAQIFPDRERPGSGDRLSRANRSRGSTVKEIPPHAASDDCRGSTVKDIPPHAASDDCRGSTVKDIPPHAASDDCRGSTVKDIPPHAASDDCRGSTVKVLPYSGGLDCVFECAGEQSTLDQAVALLKPGGRLAIVGIPESNRISFDPHALRRNEITIVNVRRQNECTRQAIELIASSRVNVDSLITHHFPLAQTQQAFEMVSARRDGVIKAIIDLSED